MDALLQRIRCAERYNSWHPCRQTRRYKKKTPQNNITLQLRHPPMCDTVYLPSREELFAIPGMDVLVHSLATYVSSSDLASGPTKVALVYKAMCEALMQQQLLDAKDIAPLNITCTGRSYRVRTL